MHCLILDDSPVDRMVLEGFVDAHEVLELTASCATFDEARAALDEHAVDLVLLDVELAGDSGLALVPHLAESTQVVVVSGKSDYAIDAFGFDAAGYLVKPVTFERFEHAIARARHLHPSLDAREGSTDKLADGPIFVRSRGELLPVDLRNVDYISAEKDYIAFHEGDATHFVHSTLKSIAHRLPEEAFARVHRSFIVRLDRVKSISSTAVKVGSHEIPLGASYRHALLERVETF